MFCIVRDAVLEVRTAERIAVVSERSVDREQMGARKRNVYVRNIGKVKKKKRKNDYFL